jgi:hypothetical protein
MLSPHAEFLIAIEIVHFKSVYLATLVIGLISVKAARLFRYSRAATSLPHAVVVCGRAAF